MSRLTMDGVYVASQASMLLHAVLHVNDIWIFVSETNEALVNFELTIYLTLREAKTFRLLDMQVPLVVEQLLHREDKLLDFTKVLQEGVDHFRKIRGNFPSLFKDMLRVNIDEMDATIAPGTKEPYSL